MIENMKVKSYKKKNKYINPHKKFLKKSLLCYFLWLLGYYNDAKERLKKPQKFKYKKFEKIFDDKKPWVFWVNHATFLINYKNYNIITDPQWSKNCSPIPFLGPHKYCDPAISINEVENLKIVLISHNHYDHLDKNAVLKIFKKFKDQVLWVVPQGVEKWFYKNKIKNVKNLSWWQSFQVDENIKITAVPSQHFSGRKIFDFNNTLWCGYVVEFLSSKKVVKKLYFCGDTGYNEYDFKEIGKTFGPIDLSLIPIGTYIPRKFMSPVHIDPIEAVKIHKDVLSKLSVGMHWNTFHLSEEPRDLPPYELYKEMKRQKEDFSKFLPLNIGDKINW